MLPMLSQPARGEPCNGCGVCCLTEVCGIGVEVLGKVAAPCPLLSTHHGRLWCRVIEEAERVNVAFGSHMKWRLGVGMGCYAAPVQAPK